MGEALGLLALWPPTVTHVVGVPPGVRCVSGVPSLAKAVPVQEPIVSPSSPARKLFTPSGSQGTKGHRVFEGRHSPLGYHPKIVPKCRIICR